jgi:class IIb bacteriocin, lactobin A/cerein 7B family|nr:class IIb bacteriocin, lactobin A/cerein 7B family [uncultured Neisseria sp.]
MKELKVQELERVSGGLIFLAPPVVIAAAAAGVALAYGKYKGYL